MADIAIQPLWQVLDGNGDPVPGAKATFFESGTSTPLEVYTDVALSVPHASPVVADADGIMPPVYLSATAAKVVLTTAADVAIDTIDPIPRTTATGTGAGQVSFAPTVDIPSTNVQAAIEHVQTNLDDSSSAFAKTLLDDTTREAFLATLAGVNIYSAAQATTSGTAFDFTSIPAWVTEVVLLLSGVSLSGTDNLLVQLGDSGGVETSGYTAGTTGASSAVTSVTSTAGFPIFNAVNTAITYGAIIFIKTPATNTWVSHHTVHGVVQNAFGGGIKALSATLDRVRLTRTGTDTFDAGSATIFYR